ncbi:unnamed protein product, partial [Laminaria digitata]
PVRWPTPGSVCSSRGYKKYAVEAGDDPDGLRGTTAAVQATAAVTGTRIRTRTRTRPAARTGTGTGTGVGTGTTSRTGSRTGTTTGLGADGVVTHAGGGMKLPSGGGCGGGSGGVLDGMERIERDMRGAMVAVWLAWGVRIDAARARRQRDQRRLEAGHRTQTAKLGRSVRAEAFEEQDHDGITPEVLDCIVREASLREMGRPEQADGVRKEALRARKKGLGRKKNTLQERKPRLEVALRRQQTSEMLLARSRAQKEEVKLTGHRDEALRLLQLHLSRSKRIVTSAGRRGRACAHGRNQTEQPALPETVLLKLGTVLLLAQETANRSIERALADGDNNTTTTLAEHAPRPRSPEQGRGIPTGAAAAASSLVAAMAKETVMAASISSTRDAFWEEGGEGPSRGREEATRVVSTTSRMDVAHRARKHKPTRNWVRRKEKRPCFPRGSETRICRVGDRSVGMTCAPSPVSGANASAPQDGTTTVPTPTSEDGSQEEVSVSEGLREKPEAFFCSWECARRWNLRFSPVQARHERGLRIDVAAGRLVA